MGRLNGKVAFITGGARGQGRSHALRLAEEGADIIVIDAAKDLDTVKYPLATPADLQETARQVEALGRGVLAEQVDVRDEEALRDVLARGVERFGGLDIVAANAGVFSHGRAHELSREAWDEMLAVNLTGVWQTVKVSVPHLQARGGGSIVLTSSSAGMQAFENMAHYSASKAGVIGLMRSLAAELGHDGIRVNVVSPTNVDTGMIHNDAMYALFGPDMPAEERNRDSLRDRYFGRRALNLPWIEPVDVSNAVLFLGSDEARYVTGVVLPVDAGQTVY